MFNIKKKHAQPSFLSTKYVLNCCFPFKDLALFFLKLGQTLYLRLMQEYIFSIIIGS